MSLESSSIFTAVLVYNKHEMLQHIGIAMALEAEKSACISEIKAIIGAVKGGQPLSRLERDFRDTIGTRIEYARFGFPNLLAFLRSIPEIHLNGDMLTVHDPKMAHITAMVSKQKSVKPKGRGPRFQTSRLSSYPVRYGASKRPVYAPQKRMLQPEYHPAFRHSMAPAASYKLDAPRKQAPVATKASVPPVGVAERTRYGGMVMTLSGKGGGPSAGAVYKSAVMQLEQQMSSTALTERNNDSKDLPNKNDSKEKELKTASSSQSYRLQLKHSETKSSIPVNMPSRGSSLEEQENVTHQQDCEERPSHSGHQIKVENSPTKDYKVEPVEEAVVGNPLAAGDHTGISYYPPAAMPVTKTLKYTPFSVMDSNVSVSLLTPSERLRRLRRQPVHRTDLSAHASAASQRSVVPDNHQRTVIVDREQLTIRIDNPSAESRADKSVHNHEEQKKSIEQILDIRKARSVTPDENMEAYYVLLKPIYQNSQLIGDNFFLHMVMQRKEINGSVENLDGKPFRCGLCISGLTITDCFEQMLRCKVFRERVVLLIGAMDILKGKTYHAMIIEIMRVIEYLLDRGVQSLVICTIPPIVLATIKQRQNVLLFNDFLVRRTSGSKKLFCCNIFYNFLSKDNTVNDSLYEKEATSVDVGKVVKVHLWNQSGCAVVLNALNKIQQTMS